nr:immunoglobulin heavy chain junction region [Macaca mulatta]MOW98613.1 immunoglobulin heavy chain junction region [Macaca mulatta]MOW98636.1 immunoglobulin heavy chain junction region [Macaca mulatta]MOW99304.1 immunoglobulin heavy chain junction region [Macaca mulatta]MOX02111.1 immunoglobulin heavy chain junction region [Macaca mulatta]
CASGLKTPFDFW